MGIEIEAAGRLKEAQDRTELFTALTEWLQTKLEIPPLRVAVGEDYLHAVVHPAAEPLVVAVRPTGELLCFASTGAAGPGYHIYAAEIIKALGAEFGVEWESQRDTTGYLESADMEAVTPKMTRWLQDTAKVSLEELEKGEYSQISLSMPSSWSPVVEAPVLTPMGPREKEWLQAAANDPEEAIDVWPWRTPGRNPEFYLGLAVSLMWMEAVWREPLDEMEHSTQAIISGALQQAHEADSELPIPWLEWEEVGENLRERPGAPSLDLKEKVFHEARQEPERERIGYRRHEIVHRLPGGWAIRLEGDLSTGWEEEMWYARNGVRDVHLSPIRRPASAAPFKYGPDEGAPLEIQVPGAEVQGRMRKVERPEGTFWVGLAHYAVDEQELFLSVVSADEKRDQRWVLDKLTAVVPPPPLEEDPKEE
jgi:hypothetical protein